MPLFKRVNSYECVPKIKMSPLWYIHNTNRNCVLLYCININNFQNPQLTMRNLTHIKLRSFGYLNNPLKI